MYLFYINPNRKCEAFKPVSILTYVETYVKGVEIYLSSRKMCFIVELQLTIAYDDS